jgi:hypothetical protein
VLETDWSVDEVADVSLIELSVHNPTAVDRRVRVESRLDGPVLPPRDGSVPEAGWDEHGYAGVVPAGERVALGFAVPAPPTEPPVSVSDEGRATDDEGEATAADAVRALGSADPPADALPAASGTEPADAGGDGGTGASPSPTDGPGGQTPLGSGGAPAESPPVPRGRRSASETPPAATAATATDDEGGDDPDTDEGVEACADDEGVEACATDDEGIETYATDDEGIEAYANDEEGVETCADDDAPGAPAGADPDLPPAVASWVETVARRVDDAERLTDATVAEAAAVAADRDGVDAATLAERVATDETRLRALAARATELADRAAGTDVPVDALARLS